MNLISIAKAGRSVKEETITIAEVDSTRAAAILRRATSVRSTILGIEVGVAAGKLSEALLVAAPNLYLTMVDDYASGAWRSVAYKATGDQHAALTKEQQLGTIRAAKRRVGHFGKRARFLVMSSAAAAAQVADEGYDFVFLDADHSYEGVRADLAAWWPKIRAGGWLCGHDYGGYVIVNGAPRYFGVKEAVDEWASALSLSVETDSDNTWFVRRVAE